jgi:hypothetical protein
MLRRVVCAITLLVSSVFAQVSSAQSTSTAADLQKPVDSQTQTPDSDKDRQALAKLQADEQNIEQAIKTSCKYREGETDPKKIEKVNTCVAKAIQVYRQKIRLARSLTITATDEAVMQNEEKVTGGAPSLSLALKTQGLLSAKAAATTTQNPTQSTSPGAPPLMTGSSLSNTPSTCGPGNGSNDPGLIRVHRVVMTPQVASDDFGHRLSRRFVVYQVTIENESKDYQYMLQDVSIDFSGHFNQPPGTYQYNASGQDLTLLRGVPEKGQDLDPRNVILHVLQGIGSVAGGISGLTSFGDVMGPSVALFNGSFIQGYTAIAPDHTSTQLNRLSDSAFMANTVIDKQRAKTIALFVPEDEILSKDEQKAYWKDPNAYISFDNPTGVLNAADICVDGTFIQAVTVVAPTLNTAVLASTPAPVPGVSILLTITGTNLIQGDTQVLVGTGGTSTKSMVITNDGKNGTAQITLPSDYSAATTVTLQSKTNPSLTSGAGVKMTVSTAAPTLSTAVLAKTPAPGPSVKTTLTITGTNFVQGDTQAIVGSGATATNAMVDTTDGTNGTATVTLPSDYSAITTVMLQSKANPSLTSGAGMKMTVAP